MASRLEARAREYAVAAVPPRPRAPGGLQEAATGLGGLAVIAAGAVLVTGGALDAGRLPLLTLLAMSAFVPVWEIAQVGRQLADTLAATRRVYALHAEPVTVTDGPGVGARPAPAPALELRGVTFAYPGRPRPR